MPFKKPMTYTMYIYRPDWDPAKSGPDRQPDEGQYVEFHSDSPFPVPRVGEEISVRTEERRR